MLNVMVIYCNALHAFKVPVMLVMCDDTNLALQVMLM